jgi:hypothetical protein
MRFRKLVLEEFDQLGSKQENAERIATAETAATQRAKAEVPVLPLLQELVVPFNEDFASTVIPASHPHSVSL